MAYFHGIFPDLTLFYLFYLMTLFYLIGVRADRRKSSCGSGKIVGRTEPLLASLSIHQISPKDTLPALGLHPSPPPCETRHRGGDLQDAMTLVHHATLESAARVILQHNTSTGTLFCGITRRGGGSEWRPQVSDSLIPFH